MKRKSLGHEDFRVRVGLYAVANMVAVAVYTHAILSTATFLGPGATRRKGGVSAIQTSNSESKLLKNDLVRALLLAFRRQVTICELVAGQTLTFDDSGAFENRERRDNISM